MENLIQRPLYDFLEHISDGFVALDKNWRYVYVNRRGAEMLGRRPEDLIGKHIWTEFPEGVGQPIYKAYHKAMEEQIPIQIEEYYPPLDRWLESRIFPFSEGLAIFYTEITEKKKTEKLLEQERKTSQKYLDVANTIMLVIGKNQKVRLINKKGCQILGYREEEIVGKDWIDNFLPQRMRTDIKDVFSRILAGELPPFEYYENPILTKDAGERLIAWHNTLLTDGKGNITGTLSSGEDITERKHAEEALRESEEKFYVAFHFSPVMIALATLDGKHVDVNKAYADFLGYSREEILGKSIVELQIITGNERQKMLELVQKENGSVYNAEIEVQLRDGSLRQVLFSLDTISMGGVPHRLATLLDITGRKRAEDVIRERERQLSTLISNLPGVAYRCQNDKDYTVEFISEGVGDLTGYPAEDFCQHRRSFGKMIHPDDQARVWMEIQTALQRNQHYELTYRLLTAAGGEKWVWERGQGICDAAGQLQALEGFITDITERKRAEEEIRTANEKIAQHAVKLEEQVRERTAELEQANIKLKELDHLKSLFIASMSHELRTPLNSILGFTGIILQGMSGEVTEEQKKQLSIIQRSAKHLLSLISDVIDVSKIESEKVELFLKDFDLALLLREVVESFMHATTEKGLKLSLKAPEKLVVRSDERRIKQVLNNLLSNAVKFTERGEIETRVVEEEERITIAVRDTGIGIKEKDQRDLFKAFSKITYEGISRQEGTGLGLYLSRKIANLLSGELQAESEFGKGSLFTFVFPKVP